MTMQPHTGYVEVRTTLPTREEAESLGEALVSARLATCVHISGPIHSIYRWENQIRHDTEWTCAVKTRAALYPDVERATLALHPYQTPEIINEGNTMSHQTVGESLSAPVAACGLTR